jgi:hypothetical protein
MISTKRASVILCLILAFGILTAGNAAAGTIPSLEKTKWAMYDIKDGAVINTGATWHFATRGIVYDKPEVWSGRWSKVNDNKIVITRYDIKSPYSKYEYSVTFAGNDAFVASGSDETKNRILLGVRQK